jgi:hypothetical protein
MASPHLPHARPPPSVPGMVSQLPTGGGPRPSNLPSTTPGPSSRGKLTTTDPKLPDGQAAALVATADTHPKCRGATPLQRSTMPVPSHGWKPRSTPTPRSSRGGTTTSTTTTNPAKLPGGQVAAPVTDEGVPPEWTPRPTPSPVRQPDGAAAAPGADAGSPPKWILRIAPSPARRPYEGGGDFEHMGSLSVLGRDTLEGWVMSGELPLTYIMSYSLSLPSPIFPSSNPILYLTGSISTDCDRYGHSHVM